MSKTTFIPNVDNFIDYFAVNSTTQTEVKAGENTEPIHQNQQYIWKPSTLKVVSPVQATVDRAKSEMRRTKQRQVASRIVTSPSDTSTTSRSTKKQNTAASSDIWGL